MVKVKFFTLLREAAGLTEDTIKGSMTVDEVIKELKRRYGHRFKRALFNDDGSLKSLYQIVINGRTINLKTSHTRMLQDNDVISFLPPVGGGS